MLSFCFGASLQAEKIKIVIAKSGFIIE